MRTPEEIEAKVAEGFEWEKLPMLAAPGGRDYLVASVLDGIERVHRHHRSPWEAVADLRAWAWLQGDDEWSAWLDDEANYPIYGVPLLRDACRRLGIAWPEDDRELNNMAEGRPCWQGCMRGCIRWVDEECLTEADARIAELEARVAELEAALKATGVQGVLEI